VAAPCQAAFDLAPYFALNPGNQLTYRHQNGSNAWVPGENSVIGAETSFYGTMAKQRKWYDPGLIPGVSTPTSIEYLNITASQICLYGASSATEIVLLNPAAASANPQGVCFPRNVDFGNTFTRTITLQIIGGTNEGTYNNVNYTVTIPSPQTPLAGASAAVYLTNGFQFTTSPFPVNVTRASQSWLAYGTGLLKRSSSGANGSTPITTETSEITAFTPAAGSICKTDALVVSTTTFNTTTFGMGTHNWTSNASITTQLARVKEALPPMAMGGVMVIVDCSRGKAVAEPPPSRAGIRMVRIPLPRRTAKIMPQVTHARFLTRPSPHVSWPSGHAARD